MPAATRCWLSVRCWLFAIGCLLCWSWPERLEAHELVIDQVSLWSDPSGPGLRGQVSFDPDLTRQLDEPLEREAAARKIREFLGKNLRFEIDSRPCRPSFDVRELYTKGGAVPGDIVMLSCPLSQQARELTVHVGTGFERLVVTVSGFSKTPAGNRQSVLVPGGRTSPPYIFAATPPEAWKPGGPEQFEPAPAAGASSQAQAPAPSARAPQRIVPEPVAVSNDQGFAPQSTWQVIWQYLWVGFAHILPMGFDHVLFVAGLALGARRRWRWLLLELSLFTVAHTLTLGLGALGVLVVPGHIVEPLIALSIAYVAAENLLRRAYSKRRLLVVLGFGLVHGQGFAGALSELELPENDFLSALFGFNLGVEVGQLVVAFLLIAIGLLAPTRRQHQWVVLPISFFTLAVGAYWVLERALG